MFIAVSTNVSPFDRLLPDEEKSTVSAPSRLPAREKLVRVRVEFSKNKLASVRPASTGIRSRQPAVAFLNISAASRIVVTSSADRLSKSNSEVRVQDAGGEPISNTSALIAT